MFSTNHLNIIKGIVLCIFIAGCNDPNQAYKDINPTKDATENVNKPPDSAPSAAKPATVAVFIPAYDTINAGERDTTVLLKDGQALVRGHLSTDQSRPTYTLTAKKGTDPYRHDKIGNKGRQCAYQPDTTAGRGI